MDLGKWRKHIDAVVADEGQWLGILDENGLPLYELGQLVSVSFPEQRLSASSIEITVRVSPGDRVVNDLIGEGLGVMDGEGRLVPAAGPTRLICLVRGGERRVATVTHTVVSGGLAPTLVTVHGVDLLDGLAWWPCPSIPAQWQAGKFTTWEQDAAGEPYATPRQLAQVPLGTRADGYTKKGPARKILRELVQDSFDAANTLMGWSDPHAFVEFDTTEDTSPETLVRVNDDPIWGTISEPARTAGLGVEVRLWWPGDTPIRVRTTREPAQFALLEWDHPVQIVRINMLKEA